MIKINYFYEKFFIYLNEYFITKNVRQDSQINYTLRIIKGLTSILIWACVLGALVSNCLSYFLAGLIIEQRHAPNLTVNSPQFNPSVSYSLIQKNILARNIFNKEGTIPYTDTAQGNEDFLLKNFEKVPCTLNEKLPVSLIGIIYSGNPKTNLVSVKDPTVNIADVYKEGQQIIDHNNFTLYKVTGPATAEFKKGYKKICVSLYSDKEIQEIEANTILPVDAIALNFAFVQEQIGPGFSKILTSARLTPEIVEGKTVGFKIFAIAKDSLFDKIQLLNGDIIKKINGIDLTDAAQGFKIYEVFKDENSIGLEIERNGDRLSKKVTVK